MKRSGSIIVVMGAVAGLTACSSPAETSAIAAADQVAVTGQVAAPKRNAVTDWMSIVAPAVHSAAEPRRPGSSAVLHTVAHLAVYDAVVAIEGGYQPYTTAIDAPDGADLRRAPARAPGWGCRWPAASSSCTVGPSTW